MAQTTNGSADGRWGRVVEVRWASVRTAADGRPERHTLVVCLQPVDADHGILEAWLDTPAGAHTVWSRQPVTMSSCCDGPFVHVDVDGNDGRRLLAATLRPGPHAQPLVYAQSDLLVDAGFRPGSYDPPAGRLTAARHGAASA